MAHPDFLFARQVGDGTRYFQDAVMSAGAEPQDVKGLFEKRLRIVVELAVFSDRGGAHLAVGADGLALEPFLLALARLLHPLADGGGTLSRSRFG